MILRKKHVIALLSSITLLFTTACGTAAKPVSTATASAPQSTTTASTTTNTDAQPALGQEQKQAAANQQVQSASAPAPVEQPKPEPKPAPVEEKPQAKKASVEILRVSSPAPRNSTASLTAKVAPGATAAITVHYKSGPSKAAGLEAKKADANGNVSWSWHVGGNTTLGSWPITVSSEGETAQTEFQVVH